MVRTKGQTLAFVDIPMVITADKWYRIVVSRYRRKKNDQNTYEAAPVQNVAGVPWHGWGDASVAEHTASSPHEIPIFIQQSTTGTPQFTPIKGWELSTNGLQWEGDPIEAALEELAPYPDFEHRVPSVGSSQTPPAAWKIELLYAKGTIRIRGVSLRRASAMRIQSLGEPVLRGPGDLPGVGRGWSGHHGELRLRHRCEHLLLAIEGRS